MFCLFVLEEQACVQEAGGGTLMYIGGTQTPAARWLGRGCCPGHRETKGGRMTVIGAGVMGDGGRPALKNKT